MTNSLELARNLLPQLEQDQQTISALMEQVQNLQEEKDNDSAAFREEVSILRSRLRKTREECEKADAELKRHRLLLQQTEGERDDERRKRQHAESQLLLREDETTALLQEKEEEQQQTVAPLIEQLNQERQQREEVEAEAKMAFSKISRFKKKNSRLKKRLRLKDAALDQSQAELKIQCEVTQLQKEEIEALKG